ncbi:DNA polymerase III subunit delta' [Kouleothrix sp.]|uniref:DNA polymerase III subunit delta' n=1 Tax=Kouleothrix sp. TaxID=2779161 RepID=UPI003918DD80
MSWDIVGHAWAIDFLRRSIAGGRAAHAYLISGPAGVGKSRLALRLAQALNCERGGPDPCLQCRACKQIERGSYPDVRVAGMASQTAGLKPEEAARQRDLKIDTVRDWLADINLRPYEGRRRVFILHDAERLTEAASNAMLKTLEEPPPYATLVLVAHTAGELLPTIVSRCQPLKLRPVARAAVAAALRERFNLATADADLLAAWSGGRIGWAIHMIAHPDELEARQGQLDELIAMQLQPRAAGFRWAEERAKQYRSGEQAAVFEALGLWQSWWRDVLVTAAGCPEQIIHIDRRAEIEQAAARFHLAEIERFVARLNDTARQLRENVNPQLALENALLHLPGA